MRILTRLLVLCGVLGLAYLPNPGPTSSPSFASSTETVSPGDQPATPAVQTKDNQPSTAQTYWNWVVTHTTLSALVAAAGGIIVIGGAVLLYRAANAGADPFILRLGPSFFFWLAMLYTALLLLMAGVYNLRPAEAKPTMLGGMLPIAVPWFGALGAVTISLEGIFLWNNQWDRKYNYWHIGRPLFGAVLGIVAFFIFIVTVSTSGTSPQFLDHPEKSAAKDFIIYYIVAFLVGYREETFRELIKRATDLILKPGTGAPTAPAVTFRVAGATPPEIRYADTPTNGTARVVVEVQNSGNAPLVTPAVAVTPIAPTVANTFSTVNDHVTGGGDLAPGQVRTVEITFTPPAAQDCSGTLTVTASNLDSPKTIRVVGRGVVP
jgi:hypothetical protein